MYELPASIKKSIRKNKPIEMDGLTFYPILVNEMDEFDEARPAIELMQQSLPVRYAVMPLLQALYALDTDALRETGDATGLFAKAVLFLALSLRLGQGRTRNERMNLFELKPAQNDPANLLALRFLYHGEEIHEITPAQFSRYRSILAAQNGLTIPDETANKDLIEARNDMSAKNAPPLEIDFDTQLSAFASVEHIDEAEVMEWPIRKFMMHFKAVERRMHFMICGIGEMSGTSWKQGNPFPSWCFDRKQGNPELIAAANFMNGKGLEAIKQQTSQKE